MTNIVTSRHVPSKSSLPYQLDVFLLTYEELSYKTLDGMADNQGAKLRELLEKASDQARQGVAWAMDRVVVVGRKPGESGEPTRTSDVVSGKGANDQVANGENSVVVGEFRQASRTSMTSSRSSKRESLL